MENEELLENESVETEKIETDEETEQTEQKTEQKEEKKRETLTLPKKEENNVVEIDGISYPKDVIEKARFQGWRDKDFLKNKGMENRYLDPQTFIDRGEQNIPFIRKQRDKALEENEKLSKMMQKILMDSAKDRLENVNTQIKRAKDDYEYDNYENLLKRKIEIQQEIEEFTEKPNKQEIQPQIPQKPVEVIDWEMRNQWVNQGNHAYDHEKAQEANKIYQTILAKVSAGEANLNMGQIIDLVDYNLEKFEQKRQQKRNTNLPVTPTSANIATKPAEKRSISNLKREMKSIYERNVLARKDQMTEKGFEVARQSFLASCDDEDFN